MITIITDNKFKPTQQKVNFTFVISLKRRSFSFRNKFVIQNDQKSLK